MRLQKIVPFICLSFVCLICSAYNKENHALITKAAIELLRVQYGKDFISEKEAKAIVKGNVSEDKFGFKWFIRPWNQHFYNPEKDTALRRNSKSINDRFERIANRCLDNTKSKHYFKRIGEVIHHIQDVTVPAHVVPVYHGGCCIKDRFDEQDLSPYLKSIPSINSDYRIAPKNKCSILDPVANQTLGNLKEKIVVEVSEPGKKVKNVNYDWSVFWKDNPQDWFGEYGKLGYANGKKGGFKDNFLQTAITVNQVDYKINPSDFQNLSKQQIDLALKATAEFIYYAINKRTQST